MGKSITFRRMGRTPHEGPSLPGRGFRTTRDIVVPRRLRTLTLGQEDRFDRTPEPPQTHTYYYPGGSFEVPAHSIHRDRGGMQLSGSESNGGGRDFRQDVHRHIDAIGEAGHLPEGLEGEALGLFVDHLVTKIFGNIPAGARAGVLAQLGDHIGTLWKQFQPRLPAQPPTPSKSRPARLSPDESWLRDSLSNNALRPLLERRLRQPLANRPATATHSGRLAMRDMADRMSGAQNLGVATSIPFRQATFFRWLVEQSPLANRLAVRRDLDYVGMGMGALVITTPYQLKRSDPWFNQASQMGFREKQVLTEPEIMRLIQAGVIPQKALLSGKLLGHRLALTEPVEALAILSRDGGSTSYWDPNGQVVQAGHIFARTGQLVTSRLKGNDGLIAQHRQINVKLQQLIGQMGGDVAELMKKGLSATPASLPTVEWAIDDLLLAIKQTRNHSANSLGIQATSELTFPREVAGRLQSHEGDLLLSKLAEGDVAVAFNVFQYIEDKPGRLTTWGAFRLATSTRNIVAVNEGHLAARVFKALGYTPFDPIPGVQASEITAFKRPARNDFHEELAREAEALLASLRG